MQYDIIIIGGGPGGIGSAVESVILGIKDVILFEKGENHSTTIRKFYKDNKRVDKDYKGQKVELNGNIYFCDGTKESTLDLFDEIIAKNNFEAQFQTEVESIKKEGEYFLIHTTQNTSIKAKFIVISIGKMGQPNKPSYPIPSTIRSVVNFNANSCQNNEKILVVAGGGGNGGDALVAARHLYNNGYNVETFISSSHLKEETLINKDRYNGKLISYDEFLKNDYDAILKEHEDFLKSLDMDFANNSFSNDAISSTAMSNKYFLVAA